MTNNLSQQLLAELNSQEQDISSSYWEILKQKKQRFNSNLKKAFLGITLTAIALTSPSCKYLNRVNKDLNSKIDAQYNFDMKKQSIEYKLMHQRLR